MTKKDAMTENINKKIKNIPLENFFKNPEITQVRISPNGKYLAYLKPFQKRLNVHVKSVDGKEPEQRLKTFISFVYLSKRKMKKTSLLMKIRKCN